MYEEYEKTIEACLRREASQWEIGDALIIECGSPGKKGDKDGSYDKIKEVAKVLESKGVDYSFNTLRVMRETSFAWGNDTRLSFSWSVHRLFNEHQKWLRDWGKKNPEETMTVTTAQNLIKERQEAREKREQKAAEALAAAEAADNNETGDEEIDNENTVIEGNGVDDNTDTQYVPDTTEVSEEETNDIKLEELKSRFTEIGDDLWGATIELANYLKDNDLKGGAEEIIKMSEDIREELNKLLSLVRPKRSNKPKIAVDNTTNLSA